MKILADTTLPHVRAWFPNCFNITTYQNEDELPSLLKHHDILLCRSTLKVTEQLLANSPIQCVATASSGIDHIDDAFLKQQKITLLDAKGCNALAVADYIVTILAWLEKEELIPGNQAGVIGGGAAGSRVFARLQTAGYTTHCYDPLIVKPNPEIQYGSFSQLFECDILLVHANLHSTQPYPSANLINDEFLTQLKPGTILINAARGGIVQEESLLNHRSIVYCTDVYKNEPTINAHIVEFATLCTPHIAGHSIEAKIEAVMDFKKCRRASK